MPSDSAAVDAAVFNRLIGDATLTTTMPDGVRFDIGPKSATRFVLISMLAHEDGYMFEGSAWERFIYLVKAVAKDTTGTSAATAAQRIHTLLQGQPLTITGYGLMRMDRLERVRYTEPDETNQDEIWWHRGGQYEVLVSPS